MDQYGALRPMLGQVNQIAFLTRDINTSMAHFVGCLGIGPWFLIERTSFVQCRYRGVDSPVELTVALASCRGLEFELMQPINDVPSMWRDAMAADFVREQFHHFCHWPDDYDATLAQALSLGYAVEQDGATIRGRFAYLQHPLTPNNMLEITESSPERRAMQDLVASAAANWDGGDSIRTGWAQPTYGQPDNN